MIELNPTIATTTDLYEFMVALEQEPMARDNRKQGPRSAKNQVPEQLSLEGFLSGVSSEIGNNNPENRVVRVLAKSADSPGAKAVWSRLEALSSHGIKVLAVFTNMGRKRTDRAALEQYAKICGADEAASNIRIARIRNSSRMVEQVQMGEKGVWSSSNKKASENDLIGETDENSVSAAKIAFQMTWAISDEIDRSEVSGERREGLLTRWGRKSR